MREFLTEKYAKARYSTSQRAMLFTMDQKLLDLVSEVARLKHLSIRTEKLYRFYIQTVHPLSP